MSRLTPDGGGSVVKAAICRAFGEPLTIEEVLLEPPGPHEVRVDVLACAVCHSDLLFIEGGWGGDLPAVFGHEAAGRVADVGPNVTDLTVGQHVVVTLVRSCGDCARCLRGESVACTAVFALDEHSPLTDQHGTPLGHGLRTAAFAEQVLVHRSQVVAIPDDLPMAAASLLACGVLTGVGAVANTAGVEPGSTVVVIGCGGVGLNIIQGARLAEASKVIAVDLEVSKFDMARQLGATHTVDPRCDDAVAIVAAETDGLMADYVFVAAGAKAAIDSGFALVGAMGALVLVGMPASGVTTEIDPVTLASSNQRILGSKMGTSTIAVDVPSLVEVYRAGRLQLDGLVSGEFPLERINEAIGEVRAGTALRNVIVFDRIVDPKADA